MDEPDGSITLAVAVIGNNLRRPAEVIFSTRDGSATSIDLRDFENLGDVLLQFNKITGRRTVTILIDDDDILENIENFFGELRTSDGSVGLNPAGTEIQILNSEDGKEQCLANDGSAVKPNFVHQKTQIIYTNNIHS